MRRFHHSTEQCSAIIVQQNNGKLLSWVYFRDKQFWNVELWTSCSTSKSSHCSCTSHQLMNRTADPRSDHPTRHCRNPVTACFQAAGYILLFWIMIQDRTNNEMHPLCWAQAAPAVLRLWLCEQQRRKEILSPFIFIKQSDRRTQKKSGNTFPVSQLSSLFQFQKKSPKLSYNKFPPFLGMIWPCICHGWDTKREIWSLLHCGNPWISILFASKQVNSFTF